MKNTLFALISIYFYCANASELEKLSYMPAPSAIYYNVGLGYSSLTTSINGPGGTVAEVTQTMSRFEYTFGYGLSENIALGLRGSYLFSSKSDYSYGPGSSLTGTSSTYKRSGLKEPTIAVMWRSLNNTNTKARVQLFGGVQPQLLAAKEANTTTDGNNANAGTELQFGVGVYKEVNDIEISLSAKREILMNKKTEDVDNPAKTTESTEHQKTDIQISIQGFISQSISLGGNLQLESSEGYNSKYYTSSVLTTNIEYDAASMTSLEVISKLKMSDSTLIQFTLAKILSSSNSAKIGNAKINTGVDQAALLQLDLIQEF